MDTHRLARARRTVSPTCSSERGAIPKNSRPVCRAMLIRLYNGSSPRQDRATACCSSATPRSWPTPHSGEGIRPAIESGLMAAEVILAAIGDRRNAAADFGPDALEPYRGGSQPGSARRRLAVRPIGCRPSFLNFLGARLFASRLVCPPRSFGSLVSAREGAVVGRR